MHFILEFDLPGQGFSWHLWVSIFIDPSFVQLSPPCSGLGLSHTRVRLWSPPPQDTGQAIQSRHSDQPPLTSKIDKKYVY